MKLENFNVLDMRQETILLPHPFSPTSYGGTTFHFCFLYILSACCVLTNLLRLTLEPNIVFDSGLINILDRFLKWLQIEREGTICLQQKC
jgi:hypothetical protein